MTRVSDIIDIEEIKKWTNNKYILIKAPTGTGKSYFILNILAEYCKAINKNILVLTNRNLLKEQLSKEIADSKRDNITIMNYQSLEEKLLKNKYVGDYQYICMDEIHYIWTDSDFNIKTNLSLNWIENCNSNSIKILCSATCRIVEKYQWNKEIIKYEIPTDYSYIDQVYFYKDNKVIQKMIYELPPDEKVLYFLHSAKEAYLSSLLFDKASFICSKYNKHFVEFSNDEERKNIINNQVFNSKILCTTATLDTGVTIKDYKLKHIICDILDVETLQQCIGRKRPIDNLDTVTIYIMDRNNRSLNAKVQCIENELNYITKLQEDGNVKFADNYYKMDFGNAIDIIPKDNGIDYEVNKAKHFKLLEDKEFYNDKINEDYGYMSEICDRLNINFNEVILLEWKYDALTLVDYLDSLVAKKLFKDKQEKLKEFFLRELFNCIKPDHGSLGMKTINGYFEDNNIDYRISSGIENSRKSENWKKTFWIIIKTID